MDEDVKNVAEVDPKALSEEDLDDIAGGVDDASGETLPVHRYPVHDRTL